MASREPVDAPDGTAARPITPDSSRTSHSTVGLPRESMISRPIISTIALMSFSLRKVKNSVHGSARPAAGRAAGALLEVRFEEAGLLDDAVDLDQGREQLFHARQRHRVRAVRHGVGRV